MSYIKKLDILLEAEGPSRRDFNKSVVASAASSNLIPNMAGVAKVASTGATAAVSSLGKILTALDSYFLDRKGNNFYKILCKAGKDELLKTKEFIQKNPTITYDEAIEQHPLAQYFAYDTDEEEFGNMADLGLHHADDTSGAFIDSDYFGGSFESIIFNKLYLNNGNEFTLDWISHKIDGDLIKHVSGKFGGFKNFFNTLADAMEEEGSVHLADRLANVLGAIKNRAPSFFRTLGLKVNPYDIRAKKEKMWADFNKKGSKKRAGIDDSASINAEFEIKKLESDFFSQLRENGLVGDKFDKYVELHKDSTAKMKAKVDKQGRIDKLKETEEKIKAPRREKKFDDEAINRWEDEGGALGPLDEAIRRLLNVIF